jgi:hypothetical protein
VARGRRSLPDLPRPSRFQPRDADNRQQQRHAAHDRGDGHEARHRERIEGGTGAAGGDRDPEDHHDPEQRGGAAAMPRLHPLRHEGEQRRPRRAHSHTDQDEREHRQREAGDAARRGHRNRDRRQHPTDRERGAPEQDERRPLHASIRLVAEARSRHLHQEVQCHEDAGDRRRERELDDHDAVERRRHQRRHGADCHLRQTTARDVEPGRPGHGGGGGHGPPERGDRHGIPPSVRSPTALTIIPVT